MAKDNKKFVKSITSRDEDFAQWYTDVVREAELCDYSSVKGCLNYLPNGYAIWENIKADLDKSHHASALLLCMCLLHLQTSHFLSFFQLHMESQETR